MRLKTTLSDHNKHVSDDANLFTATQRGLPNKHVNRRYTTIQNEREEQAVVEGYLDVGKD